jgi:hypothetical protein
MRCAAILLFRSVVSGFNLRLLPVFQSLLAIPLEWWWLVKLETVRCKYFDDTYKRGSREAKWLRGNFCLLDASFIFSVCAAVRLLCMRSHFSKFHQAPIPRMVANMDTILHYYQMWVNLDVIFYVPVKWTRSGEAISLCTFKLWNNWRNFD